MKELKRLSVVYVVLLVATSIAVATRGANGRPNVIVVMIDDLRWSDADCYESDLYDTPNVDPVATKGIRFTNAYGVWTVCSPTRDSIMTGMHPARLRLMNWINGVWEHLDAELQAQHPFMPPEEWT